MQPVCKKFDIVTEGCPEVPCNKYLEFIKQQQNQFVNTVLKTYINTVCFVLYYKSLDFFSHVLGRNELDRIRIHVTGVIKLKLLQSSFFKVVKK